MEEELTVEHAEKLLAMENNGGWQLPENSTYEFDKDNGIKLKSDKK